VAGQLATLTRFGSLGHLDFQLRRAGEIRWGDSESTGGRLFNRAVSVESIGTDLEAGMVFATLTGIGFATDAVEGDGQALVCFGGQGAQTHAGRGEAAANVFDWFHLFQRNGRSVGLKTQQVARGD